MTSGTPHDCEQRSPARYDHSEFARRGKDIYEQTIRPEVEPQHVGKFVAIDIETGDWEMDADDYTATERLLKRSPHAQTWLVRVGSKATYRSLSPSRKRSR